MAPVKDDWVKTRSHGHGLSEDEKEVIRKARLIGRPPRDVARELKCSTRVVAKYYRIFAGHSRPERHSGAPRGTRPKPARRHPSLPDRFYHSNFEPE